MYMCVKERKGGTGRKKEGERRKVREKREMGREREREETGGMLVSWHACVGWRTTYWMMLSPKCGAQRFNSSVFVSSSDHLIYQL